MAIHRQHSDAQDAQSPHLVPETLLHGGGVLAERFQLSQATVRCSRWAITQRQSTAIPNLNHNFQLITIDSGRNKNKRRCEVYLETIAEILIEIVVQIVVF